MRLIPPAKTANVRAVWKQKLRSMCHPFLLILIVLLRNHILKLKHNIFIMKIVILKKMLNTIELSSLILEYLLSNLYTGQSLIYIALKQMLKR